MSSELTVQLTPHQAQGLDEAILSLGQDKHEVKKCLLELRVNAEVIQEKPIAETIKPKKEIKAKPITIKHNGVVPSSKDTVNQLVLDQLCKDKLKNKVQFNQRVTIEQLKALLIGPFRTELQTHGLTYKESPFIAREKGEYFTSGDFNSWLHHNYQFCAADLAYGGSEYDHLRNDRSRTGLQRSVSLMLLALKREDNNLLTHLYPKSKQYKFGTESD